jgi:hypothetical protein
VSKRETPMTRWYWQRVGGTLIEEFCVVPRSRACGIRLLDGVIIKDGPLQIARRSDISVEGKDITEERAAKTQAGGARGGATIAPLVARHSESIAISRPPGYVEAEGKVSANLNTRARRR